MVAPTPQYPKSAMITSAGFDEFRCHRGDGDRWPITWADDGHLYGAGDSSGSPMNVWPIKNGPQDWYAGTGWAINVELVHPLPVDPKIYCQSTDLEIKAGVGPAGRLSLHGTLYLAVELPNYGDDPAVNRQHNLRMEAFE